MTKHSGYEKQITIWAPCHPDDPESMRNADAVLIHISEMLQTPDILDHATVLLGRRKWYQRRKPVPTPAPSASAVAGACEPVPEVTPIPQVQEGRAGDEPPTDIPSVSSPAGDTMPEIPEELQSRG